MVNQMFCLVFIPWPTPSPLCLIPGSLELQLGISSPLNMCLHVFTLTLARVYLTACSCQKRFSLRCYRGSSKWTCHPGVQRTLQFLCQHFWWPSRSKDVSEFVVACSVCVWGKASHCPPAGPFQPLSVPSCPWSHIAGDFVTVLPPWDGNTPESAYRKSLSGPGPCPLLHHGSSTQLLVVFSPLGGVFS